MRFDPKAYKGRRACVLGLGKSGLACAKLLLRKGYKVFASDARPKRELAESLGRLPAGLSWEGGGHSDRVLSCAFAVKSPGMAPSLPVFEKLRAAGIPVFSELEVALAFSKSRRVVAITGTNGKTTTTALAGAIFAAGLPRGRRALVCGNIGVPISAVAPSARPGDALIIEVSSYQLEDSRHFHPQAAALLNITADHLDHHGGMEAYVRAKARLFAEQGPEDVCVFNAADPLAMKLSRDCRAKKLFFGGSGPAQAWLEKGKIHVKLPGGREARLTPPALPGRHNLDNAMAAVLLGLASGLPPAKVQKALRGFKGVEHRLEEAGTFRGIRCVNDSKATNVDSTLVALEALSAGKETILLILGGLHKGSPYSPLKPLIEREVKGILTIGAAARKIEDDLGGLRPIFPCGDLRTAVDTAFRIGAKGDVLLLSPACASFDQFRDFEDRGRQFKALVRSRP